jgi:hypothetical protein
VSGIQGKETLPTNNKWFPTVFLKPFTVIFNKWFSNGFLDVKLVFKTVESRFRAFIYFANRTGSNEYELVNENQTCGRVFQ